MGDIVNSVADLAGIGPASKQSKATKAAAKTAADSARYSADLQKQMFDKQIELQDPFRQSGLAAQNRLNELLGLTPAAPAAAAFTPSFDESKYLQQNPDVAAGIARGQFTSGLDHYNRFGVKENRAMPMTQAPVANMMAPRGADYGKYARDFGMTDFQADPGYAFRLKEGQQALDRSAAARGGMISGGALKAAARYGQDMGSQEFTNAYNRYQTNRANQLNPLQSITGAGQTATNQLGGAAQSYGANAGNIAMNAGANAGNALLAQGNINASQYGTYGKGLDQVLQLNKPGANGGPSDWQNIKSTVGGWFS